MSFNFVAFVIIPISIGTRDIRATNTRVTGTIGSSAVDPNSPPAICNVLLIIPYNL